MQTQNVYVQNITKFEKNKEKDIDTKQMLRYYIHTTKQKQMLRNRNKTEREVKQMIEKIYYSASDIAAMLGISMGKAYKILRQMNEELSSKGFLTIAGKIPVAYFREKWYGASASKEVAGL